MRIDKPGGGDATVGDAVGVGKNPSACLVGVGSESADAVGDLPGEVPRRPVGDPVGAHHLEADGLTDKKVVIGAAVGECRDERRAAGGVVELVGGDVGSQHHSGLERLPIGATGERPGGAAP